MFTLPSNLSEAERIKLLLFKKDDPVQQNYVFLNAKNIFRGNPDNIQEAVIPVILENVQVWNETVQTQAGDMFSMLIEQKIILEKFHQAVNDQCTKMLSLWT